jgi:hypothetical protein
MSATRMFKKLNFRSGSGGVSRVTISLPSVGPPALKSRAAVAAEEPASAEEPRERPVWRDHAAVPGLTDLVGDDADIKVRNLVVSVATGLDAGGASAGFPARATARVAEAPRPQLERAAARHQESALVPEPQQSARNGPRC